MARVVWLLAVVTLLGAVASARSFPRWHQLHGLGYSFKHFVEDANRQYAPGSEEWKKREAIFNARLADIKAHNADSKHSWKRGVNHFADWTADEWQNYNRAVPDPNRRGADSLTEHAVNPTDLPKFVDYRVRVNPPVLTGIKNQGSCGSCWAHAATETMESYFALRYGQLPVLSVQQVTACTATQGGCGGGSYSQAWDFVQMYGGVNEEWTYPYTDFFAPAMEKKFTSACQNISAKFPTISHSNGTEFLFTWWPKANVSTWAKLPRNDAPAVMSWLAKEGPITITVASGQWGDYESGILQNNYSTAATNATWQSLDHDVQLVGYGYDFDLSMSYWIVRNSWGTNYGEEGFIRLLRPEVEPCGDIFGETICGTSGLLVNPGYVQVKPLGKQNGYYF